jgi:SP family myo-inositol transporter-like MFS transporter 13
MAHTNEFHADLKEKSEAGPSHVEDAGLRPSLVEEATELSGIEATAASKAAWLISVTVSFGGFLFGEPVLTSFPKSYI